MPRMAVDDRHGSVRIGRLVQVSPGDERLRIERAGPVLRATLSSPPWNSVDATLHEAIQQFLRQADADPAARVIVVTGAGDRAFSSGGDIDIMAHDLQQSRRELWLEGARLEKQLLQQLLNLSKPLICRINGDAMGFGATLAVLADFSVMVDTARIADTHVNMGLCAGDGGALLWPLLMGFAKARYHLLTGARLSGQEAAQLGLITEAVPRGQLDSRVEHYVQRMVGGAAIAINNTKIAINLLLRSLIDPLLEAHYGLEVLSALSDDHREAVAAIQAGRKPVFTGR